VNTRAINIDLILNRATQEDLSGLAVIASNDPDLSILSPLAKAAYIRATSGPIPEEVARVALSSIFAIAGEDGEALREGESIIVFTNEYVNHSIELDLPNDKQAKICFHSEGSVSDFLGNSEAWISLDSIPENPIRGGELAQEAIAGAIVERIWHSSPQCYPSDTDFIGVITYGISTIGDFGVDGFSACDYCNAFEVAHQSIDLEESDDHSFRWTDLLSEDQLVDIASKERAHPPEDWEWISREQMLESYQNGEVVKCGIDRFLLCFGSGEQWRPDGVVEDEWTTSIDEEAEDEDFCAFQMPILTISYPIADPKEEELTLPVLDLIDYLYRSLQKASGKD
jgi:hypothetical protein